MMHFGFLSQTSHCSLLQQKMSTSDCNFSGSVKQKFPWQKYSISHCHHLVKSCKKYSMLFSPWMKYCFSFKYKTSGHLSKTRYEKKYILEEIWNLIFIYIWCVNVRPALEFYNLGLVGHLDVLLFPLLCRTEVCFCLCVLFGLLLKRWKICKVFIMCWIATSPCPYGVSSSFDPGLNHETCFG